MNIAEFCIKKKVVTISLTVLLIAGGLNSYQRLGRLEDPEFSIKEAQIYTPYPGATAEEVSEEVTNVIEMACQQLGQLKKVRSDSHRGSSIVKPEMKDKYDKTKLPQIWDELRKKVGDAQKDLPPGAGPSIVNDDFGDVYGVYFAITGKGYSYADLKDFADLLRRELLLVEDVQKVDLYGVQNETIYVEMLREKMTQLGITQDEIYDALKEKNLVHDAGNVEIGTEFIPLSITGDFTSPEQFGELLISHKSDDRVIFLKDVATVQRGYVYPPAVMLKYNGEAAVGVGISTVDGGNVVHMGEGIEKKLKQLQTMIPAGMKINVIAYQSQTVVESINGFIVNLIEAVLIVILILLIFMGVKSGLIIGFILFLTIAGSFIFMDAQHIVLQRISLGALIIALGMLVDNAIVITDGILVRIEQGMEKIKAASEVVANNMMPLLGATIIAVLAFGAIGLSQDTTGEYCKSLFQVICISLLMSWVTAVTVTPLLCVTFFKVKVSKETNGSQEKQDAYGGAFYGKYRGLLQKAIDNRKKTLTIIFGMFLISLFLFGFVESDFFPNSTRPQFLVDIWVPEGSFIGYTEKISDEIAKVTKTFDGVTDIAQCIGQGSMRFLLTYTPENPNTSYAQLIVSVDDYKKIDKLSMPLQTKLDKEFPTAVCNVKKLILGPGEGGRIQCRISGPDFTTLRELASKAENIMRSDPNAKGIRSDWRNMTKTLQVEIADIQARNVGIERSDIAEILKQSFEGYKVGLYREGRKLINIVSRPPAFQRQDINDIQDLLIWSPIANQWVPIRQIITGFNTVFENSLVCRRNRFPTITIHCDARVGVSSELLDKIKPKIEDIDLPEGYFIEWGGQYEDSHDANASIAGQLPFFFTLMVFIVIFLFDSIKKTLTIWLTVPLAIIGVTFGLLVSRQPMGFMSILGVLSLSGMIIKNAIVLIDEITRQISEGKDPYSAIVDSGVCRMRPVMMAALTTVLGVLPLLTDAFFVAMAVAIMFGLTFATVLTLVVVPVLYATFFKIRKNENS
ncbi:MAG: efflux RND transporter permease subunit [Candidatus Omnitrophica bacterium]|nr:efflux RND transporter permease subunit [Candidatus Omnitrophota bacterium]